MPTLYESSALYDTPMLYNGSADDGPGRRTVKLCALSRHAQYTGLERAASLSSPLRWAIRTGIKRAVKQSGTKREIR